MARKRSEASPKVEKRITALMARGGTAESIAKELEAAGITISARTIGRRMRELRGDVAPKRTSASAELRAGYAAAAAAPEDPAESEESAEPLPAPDAIPEVAIAQIDRWLKRAERMGKAAVAKGDLTGMGQMGRLTSALLEAKRKATPPDRPDPNDDPDMVTAAARAREMLHRLVDQAIGRE